MKKNAERLIVGICFVVLLMLGRSALAANGGSACATTVNSPNTNPTLATCPTGNCWGPDTKCAPKRVTTGVATEWVWDPVLNRWVKSGATYQLGTGNTVKFNTCLCVNINNGAIISEATPCCKLGVLTDTIEQKHVATVGECGIPGCPPGTCKPSQVEPRTPPDPDEEIIEDCG